MLSYSHNAYNFSTFFINFHYKSSFFIPQLKNPEQKVTGKPRYLPVEEMAFWQNGKKNFNGLEYNTVYAKDETLLEHIFTLKQE